MFARSGFIRGLVHLLTFFHLTRRWKAPVLTCAQPPLPLASCKLSLVLEPCSGVPICDIFETPAETWGIAMLFRLGSIGSKLVRSFLYHLRR